MDSVRELELSYTFNYSQDLLFGFKQWLDGNFSVTDQYVEIIDKNNARTRIHDGVGSVVHKKLIDSSRFVVAIHDNFVPLVKRESVETAYDQCSETIKRLCKTRVYQNKQLYGNVEIKFELLYYETNTGDYLDPLSVTKVIALYNYINADNAIDITSNSHVGSDEILANCRLEYEYDDDLSQHTILGIANLINTMERTLVHHVITPFLSHTAILNELSYRPFVDEKLLSDNVVDITWWALKLDGVRGKGYIVNGAHVYIELDDMQLFSGPITTTAGFLVNKVVGVQVEFLQSTFFITDMLSLYKYKYDNRNQYDIAPPTNIDVSSAVCFMNQHNDTCIQFGEYRLKFQRFYRDRSSINTEWAPNDGYIGLNKDCEIVKIKPQKSYEMKYQGDNMFVCSFGVYNCDQQPPPLLIVGGVYEVIIKHDNIVTVIKERPDRLISN